MRAKEFILERSFSPRKSGPMSTTYMFPDMPSSDPYQAYRFGMAMANHTAKYAEGPVSQKAVIIAYTTKEEEIIHGAERQTGRKGVVVADKKSHESLDTDTKSPVAQIRKNKYGI